MKILLLGGTGVIGRYLSDRYLKKGVDVYVTSRSIHSNQGTLHYLHGNAKDNSFLSQVCGLMAWDAIVDFMSYKTQEFEQRASLLLQSTKQYVFISTARVYGNLEHPIKESSPRLLDCCEDRTYLATDEYALTKARQENLLIKSGKNNYTIIRPCITYGPERMQLGVFEKESWLYRILKGRTVVFCNEIAERITTMTIGEDICKLLYSIIGNEKSIGETIHLTSDYHRTWKEIWAIYSNYLEKEHNLHPKLKIVPLSEFLTLRSSELKYQVIYDRVYNRDYNINKELKFCNSPNFTPPEKGLPNCLEEFLKDPIFKRINWKSEAKQDRLTNERTPLNEISGFKNKIKYLLTRYL